jgi:hypothetical protein
VFSTESDSGKNWKFELTMQSGHILLLLFVIAELSLLPLLKPGLLLSFIF